jgi:hypothetical protein
MLPAQMDAAISKESSGPRLFWVSGASLASYRTAVRPKEEIVQVTCAKPPFDFVYIF